MMLDFRSEPALVGLLLVAWPGFALASGPADGDDAPAPAESAPAEVEPSAEE